MKKKILTLILVLFSWIISTNAQTLKFLPDTSEKSILVYKQSATADTLLFVKKVDVPEVLAASFTTGELVTFLNQNESDSFAYEISLVSKSVTPSNYYILPPTVYSNYKFKGVYFSAKELSFKALEYPKKSVSHIFNGVVKTDLLILFLSIIVLLCLMLGIKFILALTLGIRTYHDFVLYILLYLFMSIFFSNVVSLTFMNLWIMIFFILPTIISALGAYFIIEKAVGYKRVS